MEDGGSYPWVRFANDAKKLVERYIGDRRPNHQHVDAELASPRDRRPPCRRKQRHRDL
jgi:hypothetical protein